MNWDAQRDMDKDVEENKEFYDALGRVELDDEDDE
jgi:hypothetical protein